MLYKLLTYLNSFLLISSKNMGLLTSSSPGEGLEVLPRWGVDESMRPEGRRICMKSRLYKAGDSLTAWICTALLLPHLIFPILWGRPGRTDVIIPISQSPTEPVQCSHFSSLTPWWSLVVPYSLLRAVAAVHLSMHTLALLLLCRVSFLKGEKKVLETWLEIAS